MPGTSIQCTPRESFGASAWGRPVRYSPKIMVLLVPLPLVISARFALELMPNAARRFGCAACGSPAPKFRSPKKAR